MRIDRVEYHLGKVRYFQIISEQLNDDLQKRVNYQEVPKNNIPRNQLKILHQELRKHFSV